MTDRGLCCYFCGKEREKVRKLIAAGNPAYCAICDECVELCVEIIREDAAVSDKTVVGRTMEHVRR